MPYRLASSADDAGGGGPGLIEVRTDRAENVTQHRSLFARVAEQL
jgi:hypothetical protein